MVGVVDTGLDWNSCFFKDDKVTPKFTWPEDVRIAKRAGGEYDIWESKKHRKVLRTTFFMLVVVQR